MPLHSNPVPLQFFVCLFVCQTFLLVFSASKLLLSAPHFLKYKSDVPPCLKASSDTPPATENCPCQIPSCMSRLPQTSTSSECATFSPASCFVRGISSTHPFFLRPCLSSVLCSRAPGSPPPRGPPQPQVAPFL